MSFQESAQRVAADCGTAVEETARCEEHLQWATECELVRMVSAKVPPAILPDGWSVEMIDLRVNPPRGGRPTDDAVYESNRVVWDRVSRGNCFVRLTTPHRGKETFVACRALRKFTGGPGDDDDKTGDDGAEAWMTFLSHRPEDCDTIVSMAKVNGEAAHWAARTIPDAHGAPVTLHIFGSKNVHLAVAATAAAPLHAAAPAALAAYEGDQRFRMALVVARAVLARANPATAAAVADFMSNAHVSANFELVTGSYQHVVPYASHAEESDDLHFCCWTANRYYASAPAGESSPDGGLPSFESAACLAPAAGLEHAEALGLQPCAFDVVDGADCEAHATAVRGETGTEGRVLYFVKDGACVGLQKRKSLWYILLRALREKSKSLVNAYQRALKNGDRSPTAATKKRRNRRKKKAAAAMPAERGPLTEAEKEALAEALATEWKSRVSKRVREVKRWTGMSDEATAWWSDRCAGFITWLAGEMVAERISAEEVGVQFVGVMLRHFGSEEELLRTCL